MAKFVPYQPLNASRSGECVAFTHVSKPIFVYDYSGKKR